MKIVYLLRHAKSRTGLPGQSDHDRPLSRRGRESCLLLAEHFARSAIRPEQVVCSTSVRTRETLQRLYAALGQEFPTRFDRALYLAEAEELLRLLRRVGTNPASVLLVGHNPGLELLALQLAGNHEDATYRQLRAKFPTGTLATIVFALDDWRKIGPDLGRLVEFVTPASLVA